MIGAALAAAAIGIPSDARDRILARLTGAIGADARATSKQLARQTLAESRASRAALAAAVRVPLPPGLRGVHGSWLEHALRELPFAARAAVSGAPSARPEIAVWLVRWACAEIPAMPPIATATRPIAEIDHVLAWPEADLARWLHEVGADQLAYSSSAAGEGMAAAVARRYPAVRDALARIAIAPRHGQLGPARAAIERCRVATIDDGYLQRIGARTIAPHLARSRDPFAAAIVARRLPRSHGVAVEAELRAHADDPIDRGPAWPALAA